MNCEICGEPEPLVTATNPEGMRAALSAKTGAPARPIADPAINHPQIRRAAPERPQRTSVSFAVIVGRELMAWTLPGMVTP